MTEKEKMLLGELYNASDALLSEERARARRLLQEFNASMVDDVVRRHELLGTLLGHRGSPLSIEPPFYCDYGSQIHIGDNFYANFGCVFLDCAEIRIGNYVKFGPMVQLYTAGHPVDPIIRKQGFELARPITIGDNCWIGGNVTVCPGVCIGENCVIGAGSVVVKNIPANTIAVGNPCAVVKRVVVSQGTR
jgi:maltose O-acetyltransferase